LSQNQQQSFIITLAEKIIITNSVNQEAKVLAIEVIRPLIDANIIAKSLITGEGLPSEVLQIFLISYKVVINLWVVGSYVYIQRSSFYV
jgi:hypothetical protein